MHSLCFQTSFFFGTSWLRTLNSGCTFQPSSFIDFFWNSVRYSSITFLNIYLQEPSRTLPQWRLPLCFVGVSRVWASSLSMFKPKPFFLIFLESLQQVDQIAKYCTYSVPFFEAVALSCWPPAGCFTRKLGSWAGELQCYFARWRNFGQMNLLQLLHPWRGCEAEDCHRFRMKIFNYDIFWERCINIDFHNG